MGFSGREQAFCRGVAFAVGKLPAHIVDYFIWCLKAKGGRIADIQFQDMHACVFHTLCFVYYWSSYVI